MRRQSRRDFLVHSAAMGAAALALPRLSWAFDDGPAKPVDMAIARWKGAGEAAASLPADLTRKAIEALGGMQRFVKAGYTVWIKPNIGWNRAPQFAANTHPDVVAELIRLCKNAGAKTVKVGDYPCAPPQQSYENSGIAPAARKEGAEVVILDSSRFRAMTIGGNMLKEHPVYPEIVDCDLVINVPVCKHHGSTRVSLCMKNYMGVVDDRGKFHQDLPTTIADITQFMKPKLCVLDATRILTAHGPTGGQLDDVTAKHTIAAGIDIVALDAFGCELLGHKAGEIDTVKMGEKYGLGRSDYRKLNLQEHELS